MQDKKKDEGDQELIRRQREEQERGSRRNGEPHRAPTAGGVTRKLEVEEQERER